MIAAHIHLFIVDFLRVFKITSAFYAELESLFCLNVTDGPELAGLAIDGSHIDNIVSCPVPSTDSITDDGNVILSWTSDNSNVASVKDGVVTAHQAGKATITAASGDKSNKVEAKCVITVKPKAEIRTVNCPTGNVTLTNVGSAATVTFTVTGTELGSVANTAKVYATDTSVVQLGTLQRSAGANSDTYTVTITALKDGVSTIAFEISDPDGTAHSATCGVNITVPTPEPTPAPTPTPVPTAEPTAPPETDAPDEGGN